MGARISIQFVKGERESVALFSHWGGEEFLKQANQYVLDLKAEMAKQDKGISYPLTRLDPETVMVDFIRHLTKDEPRVLSDLYLGVNAEDGDNSDYGHHTLIL